MHEHNSQFIIVSSRSLPVRYLITTEDPCKNLPVWACSAYTLLTIVVHEVMIMFVCGYNWEASLLLSSVKSEGDEMFFLDVTCI
jgi:hypothetical protein